MSPHTGRNVRLLYAFWFLRDFQLWIPVWVVFLTLDRGFSLTQILFAEGCFLVAVVLLEVPTGAVADHWGRSRSLALGAAVLGLAVLLFAYASSFAWLMACYLLWSVAVTLMSGADMALLYDNLKAGGKASEYERLAGRGTALNWAGAGLATLLGGPVAGVLDASATIHIGAATCLVTAAAALAIAEPAHERSGPREAYLLSMRSAFWDIWSRADLRAVVLLAAMTFAALQGADYLVQPYLLDRGVEVGLRFSLLQVPMLAAGAAGGLLAGRLERRMGPALALLAIPLVAGGCFIALALSPGLAAYAVFPAIAVLATTLQPIASGYVNRRVGSERRATVLSFQGMSVSFVLAGLTPALGFTTDRWGLGWAFVLPGVVTVAALVVCGGRLPFRTARIESPLEAVAVESSPGA
jgi:MFS family permease